MKAWSFKFAESPKDRNKKKIREGKKSLALRKKKGKLTVAAPANTCPCSCCWIHDVQTCTFFWRRVSNGRWEFWFIWKEVELHLGKRTWTTDTILKTVNCWLSWSEEYLNEEKLDYLFVRWFLK